ncbi:MAG TPA: radical SAM protein [Bryobacteraceae bacterium]|nr:radical SAM protein [Bryobacteraceae bacterium]
MLLLTHGFFLAEDAKEQSLMRPYPPLGILYLSAYLRRQGFQVELYDSTFGSKSELFSVLERGAPGWLGIYANLLTRANVLDIAGRARAAGWKVVLGGPEPANYPEQYLAAGAAYIVTGEGESALERLLSGDPAPPGVIYSDPSGAIVRTPPAPQLADLDSLPWPDRERIDMDRYLAAWRQRHGAGSVSLITARGCPFHCRWCSHSVYGKTYRRRSVPAVAEEAEWILGRYNPEMLWYADDVFTIHASWTLQYAAEMKRRRIRAPFECITRADRFSPPVAEALAEMGCFRVWIGSESGSQRILDSMRRGVRVEQVQAAVQLAKSHGMETGMFLMWGYEGERIEDVEATAAHLSKCRPNVYLTTVSYPIKGTPYYEEVRDRLIPLGDWRSSTDRDVRIRGRHGRRFYQFADDLLRVYLEEPRNPIRMAAARAALEAASQEREA